MNEFFPTGPITFTSMLIVWSLGAYSFYKDAAESRLTGAPLFFFLAYDWRSGGRLRFLGLALIVSWVFARASTVSDNQSLLAAGLLFATLICLAPETKIGRVVAFLYGVRILLLSWFTFLHLDLFWFWEFNRIVLYLQIIVVGGTLLPEKGCKRILALIGRFDK